jgi:hypothetical protein
VIALILYIRKMFRRHLSPKQAVMLVEFDKLKRDCQDSGAPERDSRKVDCVSAVALYPAVPLLPRCVIPAFLHVRVSHPIPVCYSPSYFWVLQNVRNLIQQ